MKLLRILTGVHAGVQLPLTSARYVIGAEADADVEIIDWQGESIVIEVNEDTVNILMASMQDEGNGSAAAQSLLDFVPRRFGDVALCIGPDNVAWPSDMALLELLLRPVTAAVEALQNVLGGDPTDAAADTMAQSHTADGETAGEPARQQGRRRMAAWAGGAASLLLGGLVFIVSGANGKVQPAPPLAQQIERALQESKVRGVTLRSAGKELVVEGIVDDAVALRTLNTALRHFDDTHVRRKYASADDISRQIVESLGIDDIQARRRSDGVFVLSGHTVDAPHLRAAVARVASDLAPLVKRIEVDVQATTPTSKELVGAVYAAPGVQIVQTRDGRKVLMINDDVPLPPSTRQTSAALPVAPAQVLRLTSSTTAFAQEPRGVE